MWTRSSEYEYPHADLADDRQQRSSLVLDVVVGPEPERDRVDDDDGEDEGLKARRGGDLGASGDHGAGIVCPAPACG
jgi:hypothetical protein